MSYVQTLDWLEDTLQRPDGRACVFSANVDQLIRYHNNVVFRDAYKIADLIIPDGMPVVWSSKFVGPSIQQRVAGIDLLNGLCSRAAQSGYECFLLGAGLDVVRAAADNLKEKFPGL